MIAIVADRWFVRLAAQRTKARIRLVVFPFAGGGPAAFGNWCDQLSPLIDLVALQLPGRERRMSERPLTNAASAAATIADAIGAMSDLPFAMFGHSMGAMLAFETARQLRRHGRPMSAHLFVSGFRAPDLPDPRPLVAGLDDEAFLAELARLGGTPEAVLQNKELMDMLLPALRADFGMVENYRFIPELPLPCPITAFAGAADREASTTTMAGWKLQTDRQFVLNTVPGSHFFLLQQTRTIVGAVNAQLERLF